MVRQYRIVADYHQFYLWDHGTSPDAPTDFTDADVARRIKAAPHVVVVQPERNMEVPVEIEVVSDAPPLDLDRWDHVAEASLALPSGRLEIHECTGGSVDVVPVTPGTYRVRVEHGGLGTISPDGLDGQDQYRIVLWPAPFAEVAVLKQYDA
ncbi:hypothetical protein [Methylobacterium sp. 17Sr1-1]|uniref:hypothetical protein n=1 Tax=Methylobacterium sp. 17Sr1-1 TaxID=2202826 RepID=UPI000D6F9865|nr:hypothetical protein [Methylobacterium sp. 17Sr1-1]AWN54827.1 hypothetical protein DK412_27070 [Methylobacterium sp. 17Sr1-1]